MMAPLFFDFRSKAVILILTMVLVAFVTANITIYMLLGLLAVYLIVQGFGRAALKMGAVALAAGGLKYLSAGQGLTVFIPDMFLFIITRIMLMLMAACPFMGMPPGEAVAVFKKIHAPDTFALPVTFMLRFLPTVKEEFAGVFAALYLRGLLTLKHPLKALEYIIVPVMLRASRISDELAASAEARGIANPGIHTCRREVIFARCDVILSALGVLAAVSLMLLERRVI
ncbi:energy-coupling factor transport system permease protein [Lacrimispora sphenoides]|jgi:energy-coupling factor transport system permease protein|uniref:energy-coupling factor transporter transmembrane component T n=1 Tax=Lacrimispora sphenoides TaxID=29370 RepID=UPI0008B18E69|nr:energy-coupling factor transporter transmembrane component T [Lacrimispora sphenoides]SET78712.1 energy-coupling factor transport system permease protein [Lacrimispora sphenoides]